MGRTKKTAKGERVCRNDLRDILKKFGFVRVDGDDLKELLAEVRSESQ